MGLLLMMNEAEVGLDPVEGRGDQLTKTRPDSGKRGGIFSVLPSLGYWMAKGHFIEQNACKHPHPSIDSSMMLKYITFALPTTITALVVNPSLIKLCR